jgi:putative transposase
VGKKDVPAPHFTKIAGFLPGYIKIRRYVVKPSPVRRHRPRRRYSGRRQRLGFAEEGQAPLLLAHGRLPNSIYNRTAILLACFLLNLTLIIVRRIAGTGFVVIPRRWIAERTLGWLGPWQRLSKDYEELPEVSEAMVTLAAIRIMLHRLVHPNRKRLPAL